MSSGSSRRLARVSGTTLQALRREAYASQHGRCATPSCPGVPSELDHIVPVEQGGSDDRSNLQLLCLPCHRTKTALQRGQRIRVLIGPDGYPIPCDVPGAVHLVLKITPAHTIRVDRNHLIAISGGMVATATHGGDGDKE